MMSHQGAARFLSDYRQSATRYRVMVKEGSTYVPHPTLPSFSTMTEAELAAAKLAGRTRVDVERSGNGAGAAIRKDAGSLSDVGDKSTPSPHPLRCAKCGIWKDAKPAPFDDPNSICYKFVSDYPEPDGEHEWGSF